MIPPSLPPSLSRPLYVEPRERTTSGHLLVRKHPLIVEMSKPCKQPNCTRLGSSHCSACQGVWYCGVECQRANWKDHKITCRKKLLSVSKLDEFLADKVREASHLDLDDKSGKHINDLRKNILIAEYQLGD